MNNALRTLTFYIVALCLALASAIFWAAIVGYLLTIAFSLGVFVGRIGTALTFICCFGFAMRVLPRRMEDAGWR